MAKVMEGFAWVMSVGFVLIIAGLDFLKFFIDEKFWVGLYLVPILLLANVILGINTNLNVWYKVSDKTRYGIYITFVGLAVTVIGNISFIPTMGILGAAITTLVAYTAMFFASLLWGQKHYPVPYNWTKLSTYILGATAMVYLIHYTGIESVVVKLAMGAGYLLVMLMAERRGLFNFAR